MVGEGKDFVTITKISGPVKVKICLHKFLQSKKKKKTISIFNKKWQAKNYICNIFVCVHVSLYITLKGNKRIKQNKILRNKFNQEGKKFAVSNKDK